MDMSEYFWQGSRIRLRAVEPSDWEFFVAWSQASEVERHGDAIHFPKSQAAIRRWTETMAIREPENDTFFWVIEALPGQVVGTINTFNCDRRVGAFYYGIAVHPDHRRQGYASEAVLLVLRYFFQELGYQKANAHVYSFNGPSSQLHEQLGFQLEGRLRRMIFTGGRHFDVLVYGLTAEEFAARYRAYAWEPPNH